MKIFVFPNGWQHLTFYPGLMGHNDVVQKVHDDFNEIKQNTERIFDFDVFPAGL